MSTLPAMTDGSPPDTLRRMVVVYHHPCPDGGFAAAIMIHAAEALGYGAVHAVPYNHRTADRSFVFGSELDPFLESDTVVLCDCIGPRGFVARASNAVRDVVVLDHHETVFVSDAAEEPGGLSGFDDNVDYRYSVKGICGMTCAVYYLAGRLSMDALAAFYSDVPNARAIEPLVADHDLWHNDIPESRAFFHGLNAELDLSMDPRLGASVLLHTDVEKTIARGNSIVAEMDAARDKAVAARYPAQLSLDADTNRTARVYATAACSDYRVMSEVGNALARMSRDDFGTAIGVVLQHPSDRSPMAKASLRSIGDTPDVDVSAIARSHGGGGHCNAAAFRGMAAQAMLDTAPPAAAPAA